MSGLDSLAHTHPWPAEIPDAPTSTWGWGIEGAELLRATVPTDAAVVVEIGSLLGASARFFAELCPDAHLICIDPWFDVDDPAQRPFLSHNPDLVDWVTNQTDGIYQVFLASNWHLKDRLIPIRAYSPDPLVAIDRHGVVPDVVYVDGSHVYEDVLADVGTARMLFPEALLCGDDWHWPGVRHAVDWLAATRGDRVSSEGNTWVLEPVGDGARHPAPSARTVGPGRRRVPVTFKQASDRARELLTRGR